MANTDITQLQTEMRQVQGDVSAVRDDVRVIREQLTKIGGDVQKGNKAASDKTKVRQRPVASVAGGRTLSGVNMQQVAMQLQAANRGKRAEQRERGEQEDKALSYTQALKQAKPIVKQNQKQKTIAEKAEDTLATGGGSFLRNVRRGALRKVFGEKYGTSISRFLLSKSSKNKAAEQILDYEDYKSGPRKEKAVRVRTPQDAMREGMMGNARVVAQIGGGQNATAGRATAPSSAVPGEPAKAEPANETVEALKALGFQMQEIKERLAKLPSGLSVEEQIKHALADKKNQRVPTADVPKATGELHAEFSNKDLAGDKLEQKDRADEQRSAEIAHGKDDTEWRKGVTKKLTEIDADVKKNASKGGGLWMLLGLALEKIFEWGKKLIGGAVRLLLKGVEKLGAWLLKRIPGAIFRALKGLSSGVSSVIKKGLGWIGRFLKSVGLEELGGLLGLGATTAVMAEGLIKSQTLVPEHTAQVQQGLDKYGLKVLGNGRFEKDGKTYWTGMEGNAKPGDVKLPEALEHIVNAENLKKVDPFHAQQELDWVNKHKDEVAQYEVQAKPQAPPQLEPQGKSTIPDDADKLDLTSGADIPDDTSDETSGSPHVVVLPTQTTVVPGPGGGGDGSDNLLALISARNNEQSVQSYIGTIFDHPAGYGALSSR